VDCFGQRRANLARLQHRKSRASAAPNSTGRLENRRTADLQLSRRCDGLKGNPERGWQSPAVRASDGKLWFRTSEGVAIIDPQDLTRNLLSSGSRRAFGG